MGQTINKIVSLSTREVKTFNIERRAEKIISQDKPTPAPMHPTTVKELKRLNEENVSTEYLHKKDEQLNKFLKEVYVTSPDPAPPLERKINPDRPLPVKRPTEMGITYGYSESEEAVVPEGRVSLKQALAFISNHQTDTKKYSSAAIASQHKLSLSDTNDILEHFKMLSVKVHKKEVDPASLSAYERLQLKVQNMTIYNAPDIVKEVNAMFSKGKDKLVKSGEDNKEEQSLVAKRPEEKIYTHAENLVNTKERSDSGKEGMEKAQGKEDLKTKPEEDIKKTSTRKHSQENG